MEPHPFSVTKKSWCVCWAAAGHLRTSIQKCSRQNLEMRTGARNNPKMELQKPWLRNLCPPQCKPAFKNNCRAKWQNLRSVQSKRKNLIAICGGQKKHLDGNSMDFWRKELRLFPYHLKLGTETMDADKHNRVQFAENCVENYGMRQDVFRASSSPMSDISHSLDFWTSRIACFSSTDGLWVPA